VVLLFAAYTKLTLLNETAKAANTANALSDFIKTISLLRPWGFAPPPHAPFEKGTTKTFQSEKPTLFGG
jgi:hypothetical protein